MRTLKPHEYEIERETLEEQNAAGRYNPALVVVWKGNRHTLGAGTTDTLDLFEEHGRLVVLSGNRPLGYIAAEIHEAGEKVAETFVEDYDEHARPLFDLTPIYRAKTLVNWMDY
jgi:hypothetical protein